MVRGIQRANQKEEEEAEEEEEEESRHEEFQCWGIVRQLREDYRHACGNLNLAAAMTLNIRLSSSSIFSINILCECKNNDINMGEVITGQILP